MIKIEYSQLRDYQKLIFNLNAILAGWHAKNGFTVTYKHINHITYDVVIPDNDLIFEPKTLKKFHKHSKLNLNWLNLDNSEIPELYKIFDGLDVDTSLIQQEWDKVEQPFFDIVKFLVNDPIDFDIKIYCTNYGTSASYNFSDDEKTLYIMPRKDTDVSEIAYCILSGLFIRNFGNVQDNPFHKYTWIEKQKAIHIIFELSKLKTIFPNFRSNVDDIRLGNIAIKHIEKSNDIYKRFGMPIEDNLRMINIDLFYNDTLITGLSSIEKEVLMKMHLCKGIIFDYDELAEIIWKDKADASFSVEAINKVIERTRAKLKNNLIFKPLIYTQKGEGYYHL